MDMTNDNGNARDFTEIDYILAYSWAWQGMDFSAGAIYYELPHSGGPSTTELYVSAGLDAMLSPSLTLYRDIDEANGTYANLAVQQAFEDLLIFSENVRGSFELSASVGYGSGDHSAYYFGNHDSAFVDALFTAGFPVQIGERWSLTPSLNYSVLLDRTIRSASDDDHNVWAGLSLSTSF